MKKSGKSRTLDKDTGDEQKIAKGAKNRRYSRWLIVQFVLLWIFTLPVIAIIALLTDINWTKPYLEKNLGAYLERDVKLGRLLFSMGLNGIAVETSSLRIDELDGKRFMTAQRSEIGLSPLALASGKLLVKHLDFKQPDVWIVKKPDGKWNFEDLLIDGPEIRLVQVDRGIAHIVDSNANAEWKHPFDLEEMRLTFTWPRKNKRLPFYFSAQRPQKDHTTTLKVEGFGEGKLTEWKTNKYSFKVQTSQLSTRDALEFLELLDDSENRQKAEQWVKLNGMIDGDIVGNGSFTDGLKIEAAGTIGGLRLEHDIFGQISAGNTNASARIDLSDKKLSWSDLLMDVHGVQIRSSGELAEWQKEDSRISAQVTSKVTKVQDLNNLLEHTSIMQKGASPFKHSLLAHVDPANLSGTASLEVRISGTRANTNIVTKVKTDKLVFKDVIQNKDSSSLPVFSIFGVTPESQIKGNIKLLNQDKIELSSASLDSASGKLTADGLMDLNKGTGKLTFKAKKLSLKKTGVNIHKNKKALSQFTSGMNLPEDYDLALDGTASAEGTLRFNRKSYEMKGAVDLQGASLTVSGNLMKVANVNGRMLVSSRNSSSRLDIGTLTGKMGTGKFEVKGSVSMSREPVVDIDFHATSLDLHHLSGLVEIFKVDLPILRERQLYGTVKDVELRLTGSPGAPDIYLSATPDDLYYKPPGLENPLRAMAGQIVYEHDELTLKDVAIISHGNTIYTSLSIKDLSGEAQISRVKVKSEGIELADIHYYLSSPVMPPPLKKAYVELLARYKIADPRGKVYGDILCLVKSKDDIVFDGILGCFKVGFRLAGYPVSKLAGMIAASGDDLILKDMHGAVRSSRFTLDGLIKDYRTADPSWNTELTARLEPRELGGLIPKLTSQIQDCPKLELRSKGALSIRSKINGSFKSNHIKYSIAADKKDNLKVVGPFGTMYQPKGEPLTLDGIVKLDQEEFLIEDTHMLIGDTLVAISGFIKFPTPGKRSQTKTNLNITVDIPQEAELKTIVAIINPALSRDISGVVQGKLTASGAANLPDLSGQISLTGVKVPKLDIYGLDGHIKGEKKSLLGKRVTAVRLAAYDLKVRKIVIRNLSADVLIKPSSKKNRFGSILMRGGEATVAGGHLNFSGSLDVDRNEYRLDTSMNDLSARKLSDKLLGNPDEITGDAHAKISLRTRGTTNKELVKNLEGKGQVTVANGIVGRFGTLQTRITQYNLLTQGIFGFNINNMLQSVWPIRTGEFSRFRSRFTVSKGVLKITELRFLGDDMRLWGVGEANLPDSALTMEVAGKIPRVTKSRLGGTIGEVSRGITLQRAMKVATFGKLESLPALPLIGAIATDKPRTFTFNVSGPLDKPKLITKSIERSFKWLPNKPAATAHPVPGLD